MQMPIACNRKLKNGIFGVAVRSLPRRGELVRILGEELRAKTALGELVTIGSGKIVSGGLRFLYFTFTSRRFHPTRLPPLNEADSQMTQVQLKALSSTCRRELTQAFRLMPYIYVRSAMKSETVSAK
jgi:hypothetical protein